MANDPFAVLGISSSASEDEIKSAYRKLAKKYHPDLNPGDKSAEQKMREINEAYTRALQIRKTGQDPYRDPYGASGSSGASGYYGNPFGQGSWNGSQDRYGQGGYNGQYGYGGNGGPGGNPFSDFGFDPFSAFFGGQPGAGPQTRFRTRNYANPDLETAQSHVLANRYHEAISLLNRVPNHDAEWHALYARADIGLGNRVSALDHARAAVRMAPEDQEFRDLLNSIEAGRQAYRQTRSSGYDFRSAICANPCLTCCIANMFLNCCLGGCGRYGMCC